MFGSAVTLHAGLFPIELLAWPGGVITRFDGVAPSSVLDLVVAAGFVVFARRVEVLPAATN